MKQLGISVCAFKYQSVMDDRIQHLEEYVLLLKRSARIYCVEKY